MYRIKKEKNKVTGQSRYRLQVKVLFWWTTCRRELGWGCCEPIVCDTLSECKRYKRNREKESAWQKSPKS